VQLPKALICALLICKHLLDLVLHALRLHVQHKRLSAAAPGKGAATAGEQSSHQPEHLSADTLQLVTSSSTCRLDW
jgi:hypothetical protein